MTTASRVHWLGAGLSSGPGIRRLATQGLPLTLWNRTAEKARQAIAGLATSVEVRTYELASLKAALAQGDIVVSMLPAPMHPEIARASLDCNAHLVTTSYISDAMRALDAEAKEKGLSLANECGLDPGLDHMLAHKLVAEYRESPGYAPTNALSFRSYCGGFPKAPNAFRYKFSWSPLGVLRALRSPARALKDGAVREVPRVWEAIESFSVEGAGGAERFEAYPNRDSMPYVDEYGFDKGWPLQTFVRGTLRLAGWSAAWKDIFAKVGTLTDQELEALAGELWREHQYRDGEADRVVLYVGLRATRPDGSSAFDRAYLMDEAGTAARSAMGALVSLPATFAVDDVRAGRMAAGVHGAPSDRTTIARWFHGLAKDGAAVRTIDASGVRGG